MPICLFSTKLDVPPRAVFDWHARPGAFEWLLPPWAPVRLEAFDGIENGDRAILQMGAGPLTFRWVAQHHDVVDGQQFCDRQVRGPFAFWDHTHRFESVSEGGCRLVDEVEFELPGGVFGEKLVPWVEDELRRQFMYRHRVTRRDLELHRQYGADNRSLTIAVSGTTGLVGAQLVPFLTTGGHIVKRLVRSGPTGKNEVLWDPETGTVETEKLEGVDAVVHLAGESVFGWWTEAKKQRIFDSRVRGTHLLADVLAGLENPPDVFVSASAVGYYGDHGAEVVTEESAGGSGFLAEVCGAWEAATEAAVECGIRTVHARIGAVLSPAGGVLQLQWPIFWGGMGGQIGTGNQYVPWVSIDDVIGGIYHLLMRDDLSGAVNLTAPSPVTMTRYARTLGSVLDRSAPLRISPALLRSIHSEMADELLLKSTRAVPARLLESGYDFGTSTVDDALQHLLGRQVGV